MKRTERSIPGMFVFVQPKEGATIPNTVHIKPMERGESDFFFRELIVSFCGSVATPAHYKGPHLIARTRMVTIHSIIAALLNSQRIVVFAGIDGRPKEWRIVRLQRYSGK